MRAQEQKRNVGICRTEEHKLPLEDRVWFREPRFDRQRHFIQGNTRRVDERGYTDPAGSLYMGEMAEVGWFEQRSGLKQDYGQPCQPIRGKRNDAPCANGDGYGLNWPIGDR